jgi:hypothetical protein
MTGLEAVKQEMIKRGCTKAQTESKLIAVVLDIVAEAGTAYTDLREAEERMKDIALAAAALQTQRKEVKTAEETFRAETGKYIEDFKNLLRDCETAKARDALKVAQIFTDSIQIRTAYDNTAYINGLAMILCGQEIPAPIALRRVEEPSRVSARY